MRFFGRTPALMVVEPESLCWMTGRMAEARDGVTWAREFARLPALKAVVRDDGTGLGKGVRLDNARRRDAGRVPGKRRRSSTLDRTVRLLPRAMEVPGLSLELALLLVEYHIHRNKIARRSHTRTWMAKAQEGQIASAVELVPSAERRMTQPGERPSGLRRSGDEAGRTSRRG